LGRAKIKTFFNLAKISLILRLIRWDIAAKKSRKPSVQAEKLK